MEHNQTEQKYAFAADADISMMQINEIFLT